MTATYFSQLEYGNTMIQLLEIVEGVDAFEMLMIVILEQLVANFWEKLLWLRYPFSVLKGIIYFTFFEQLKMKKM